jgi:hypothetical protein
VDAVVSWNLLEVVPVEVDDIDEIQHLERRQAEGAEGVEGAVKGEKE